MTRTISVDVGSGFTQFTDGATDGFFPSVVCPVPEVMGFGAEHALLITVDGARYLVGDDAKAYGDPDHRANTLHDDWAGSTGWKVLLFAALHMVGVQDGDTVQLITGLPQALFTTKKEDLVRILSGKITFRVNGSDYSVTVQPTIIPQAAGAVFYQAAINESILREAVGVIDVGTYTTGFSVIEDGRFVSKRSSGVTIGVSQLAAAVKDYLAKEYGHHVDSAKIPQILMEKAVRHRGNRIELSEVIERLALLVARPLLDKIKKTWEGGNDLLIFIAGGGAPYYFEAIKTELPHAEIMPDSFFAVVRGMHTYRIAKG